MNLPLDKLEVKPWWARVIVGRRPLVTLVRLVVVVIVSLVVFRGLLVPIRVTGPSMEPTYRDGRVNFLNRMAYWIGEPQRGDVVGIQIEGSRIVILKRIVAPPGERVAVRAARVLVNGALLEEKYATGRGIPSTRGQIGLGEGEYFAIGDNREKTLYDVVRRRDIKGKVLF
jgi:signal peptidase I